MNTFTNAIEDIIKTPNQKELDLKYLEESELPLILYGTGTYAYYVKSFLEENEINITYVVLDKNISKKTHFSKIILFI